MISELKIKNFALADDLHIRFKPGLNILTGETGAGKSILVGAIAAVLGGRVYTEVVRTGFERASVEAVMQISNLTSLANLLREKGIPVGPELIIRREIPVKGSSRAYVNDTSITIGTLAEIGDFLVDIHGQHEHQRLLKRDTHEFFLDSLGRHQAELAEVANRFEELARAAKELRELESRQAELSSKHELYEFQYKEISQAELEAGEDEALVKEAALLSNTEKLLLHCTELLNLFNAENHGLLEGMSRANDHMDSLSPFSGELQKLQSEFTSAKIVLQEVCHSIESFQNGLAFDPQRLEAVEERIDLINRLKKKYGGSIESVLQYRDEIEKTLNLSENFELEIEKLGRAHEACLHAYAGAAVTLSDKRKETAAIMAQRVEQQMALLGMPRMRFQVRIEKEESLAGIYVEDETRYMGSERGIDVIEFFISPNPGEDFKALSKIASGGEISRIMLAMKTILAKIDEIPSLVFDEIDSGVSGRIAQAVGRSIYNLSRNCQILCITHLPQIASHGESHFLVEKYIEDGRTYTGIEALDEAGRVEAIARLMAGETITESARESARQLIEEVKD